MWSVQVDDTVCRQGKSGTMPLCMHMCFQSSHSGVCFVVQIVADPLMSFNIWRLPPKDKVFP